MSLDLETAYTPLNEEDIAAATDQLQSLLTQIGSETHNDAVEMPVETASLGEAVKQELLPSTETSPASVTFPPGPIESSEVEIANSNVSVAEGLPQHYHQRAQDLLRHKDDSSPSISQCSKKPRTELRVELKRLSPDTVAALQRKSYKVDPQSYCSRSNRHIRANLSGTRAQRSMNTTSSVKVQRPRTSYSSASFKGRADRDGNKKPSSQGDKKNIDDLSLEEVKKLLIKSQASVRSLSSKLKENEKSENDVFGRLIGKMIGGVKSRRRLEGLKLHIHNLVCETILQDMEESAT
ncbi:hypothetical protein ElyMa_004337900 [Elysia marginata]|uniref:Uncharacterized protein n=1 Tax=Elysia marginata TaxID=1093978 RepID=A0AAV4H1S7_9GAST|nr:hypothetical protein ElyMa_004337900 [Elysia marginata]